MNKKLFIYSCITILFIWLINSLANSFYWYSAIWWFDIPMHILGGVFIAFCFGSLFFKKLTQLNLKQQLINILLAVVIVGLGWEMFEYFIKIFIKDSSMIVNIPDSIKDMFMDMLGGFIASIFVLNKIKRYNVSHGQSFTK